MEFDRLRSQWDHPSGIFSLLMIVRGDVIQQAVAQLAGSPYFITPVAFSFGWVSYTVSAFFSAIGDGKLMPDVDFPSIVIGVGEGHQRQNESWVLARLLRDWEKLVEYDYPNPALVVTIFRVSGGARSEGEERPNLDLEGNKNPRADPGPRVPGVPELDLQWYTGWLVIIVQLVIATVAGIVHKLWLTMTVIFGGTILCLAGGVLPQLKEEKWSCRKLEDNTPVGGSPKQKTTILTQGNGYKHVMIIHSVGRGLDLEDLATGRLKRHRSTLPCLLVLTIFWLTLLLLVGGFSENTWCLVAVGTLGMAQNMFAAGHHRALSTTGIHLDKPNIVLPDRPHKFQGKEVSNKVFQVLKKTEVEMSEKYGVDRAGIALLPVFFPNGLRPDEERWRDQQLAKYTRKAENYDSPVQQPLSQAQTLIQRRTDDSAHEGPDTEGSVSNQGSQRRKHSLEEPPGLNISSPDSV